MYKTTNYSQTHVQNHSLLTNTVLDKHSVDVFVYNLEGGRVQTWEEYTGGQLLRRRRLQRSVTCIQTSACTLSHTLVINHIIMLCLNFSLLELKVFLFHPASWGMSIFIVSYCTQLKTVNNYYHTTFKKS